MKPNINDLTKFRDLRRALVEKDIPESVVNIIERAVRKGIVIKKTDDLALLNIPPGDVLTIGETIGFGVAVPPLPPDVRTFEFTFDPIPVEAGAIGNFDAGDYFYGYQFVLSYVNKSNFTVEEAFPIENSRRVYVDVDLRDIGDGSKIKLVVKSSIGEVSKIALDGGAALPDAELVEINKSALANSKINVAVSKPPPISIDAVQESYRIKGKLISNESSAKLDGFQIVIFASLVDSVAEEGAAAPDYFPVAYAETETNGYFVTNYLVFSNPDDITRVKKAKALIAKDEFSREVSIKLIESGSETDRKSMIPSRLILVINEDAAALNDDGCGCSELNFFEKKATEQYSYYTVVRTTEPSIITDIIEEEDEVDLDDLYGIPRRVPFTVFRKFHTAVNTQIKMDDSDADVSRAVRAIFRNENVLNRLLVEHKAKLIIKGKDKRAFKGRTQLSPVNQIDWDDEPTIYQAASIAHGHLLHFKQEWMPDGYSIGDLIYSLPLAPGQKKQIAVLDWERRESAANSQSLDYEENLNNTLIRDRDINEIVSATLNENIKANSNAETGGRGFGFGAAAMGVIKGIAFGSVLGISGGKSNSSSGASQNSSRESTGNSFQSIRDRTAQAANAARSQRATVIQSVSQGERVQATSESVANYNHCHAITIQYFQVLRHFMIQHRLAGVQECLFIPLQISPFDLDKCLRWRNALENYLFRPELRKAFDAVARIQNEKESPFENYYDSIGFPRINFAEQSINYLDGHLLFEFYFFNTKDTIDDAMIKIFGFFGIDLKLFKDRKLSDKELSEIVGPRTIEFLLETFIIEYERVDGTYQPLNLDLSLISSFRQSAPLYISVRQNGSFSIPRNSIKAIRIRLDETKLDSNEVTEVKQFRDKYMKIKVRSGAFRYRTANFSGDLFKGVINNDLFSGDDSVYIATPLSGEELRNPRGEDVDAANNLLHHLNENLEYYHKCIWFDMTPERRFMLLDGIVAPGKANGRSVASVVENRLLGIAGNSLIMPVAPGNQLDPTRDETFDLFAQYYTEDEDPMRISLPTKGVYAESVMGKCNSCEEKDESRFWRWEESPIPDSPTTPIGILNTDSRRADPGDLQPKDFANPIVNIQNAPNLPDPAGLQTALNLTGKGDAFRDLSGLNQNQLNALATFQKTMDTAQAFGKEAAELAKAAGAMKMLEEARNSGTISNEQAKEKGGEIIDQLQKDPNSARLNEGLGLVDKLEKAGIITPEAATEAKKNLLKTFTDSSRAKTPMSNEEIKNLSDAAKTNSTDIIVERADGEKVGVTTKNPAVGGIIAADTTDSKAPNSNVTIKRKRTFMTSDSQTGSSRSPRVDRAVFEYEIKNNEIEPVDFFMQEMLEVQDKTQNKKILHAQTFSAVLSPNALKKVTLEFSLNPDNETVLTSFDAPQINRDFPGDPNARIKPAGTLFIFPFPKNMDVACDQGFNTQPTASNPNPTHRGLYGFAVDFNLPKGTEIFAARGGTVVEVVEHHPDHPDDPHTPVEADKGIDNKIRIMHDDGTYAVYGHIQQSSARVKKGDKVREGVTVLALSGHNGYSTGPHLHFTVSKANGSGKFQSLKFAFDDGSGNAVTPVAGQTYKRT